MKHFGQLIVIVTLMAKAATLPAALGLSSATSSAHGAEATTLAFALSTLWLLTTLWLLAPLLGERRSLSSGLFFER